MDAKEHPSIPEPRRQHYMFAHYVLPGLIFKNLDHAVDTFSNPNANILLKELWQLSIPDGSVEPPILPIGIDISRHQLHPHMIAFVFSLPSPIGLTEAYFTALVAKLAPGDSWFRYFTLELSVAENGQPRTIFGEWAPDATHANYGDGPLPNLANFVETLARHCA